MTDRVFALTVVLEKDIRTDDVEAITNAIKMIRGVLNVTEHITDPSTYMAEERARRELGEKLWSVLYPKAAQQSACPECSSRIMDSGYCMMGHWCEKPTR